jgi:transmembrane sensor
VTTVNQIAMDEAIAWHLGLEQAGADEWRRFVAWLEASPANGEAYDRLLIDDAGLSAATVPPLPARAPRRGNVVWLRWGGAAGGLAAAAAAAWLALVPAGGASQPWSIETAPGEHRTVTLADGSRVEMNGGTRLTLDRADPRMASLERGQAIFRVVHHADRPFEVRSGGVVLQDVGTVFDVSRAGAELRVAVAEGEVLFQPEGAKVSLKRGMALAMRDGDDQVTVRRVAADGVGGWNEGHLDFDAVALGTVASDVNRSTGARLAVSPAMAGQPFTGSLQIDRPADDVLRSLAALAGGELRRDGPGWLMVPKKDGAR